jgi:hypothetical protein
VHEVTRPTLVRTASRSVFVDMSGAEHPTHAAAWRASVAGLLASRLADEGVPAPDAVAAAILEVFVLVPRSQLNKD